MGTSSERRYSQDDAPGYYVVRPVEGGFQWFWQGSGGTEDVDTNDQTFATRIEALRDAATNAEDSFGCAEEGAKMARRLRSAAVALERSGRQG